MFSLPFFIFQFFFLLFGFLANINKVGRANGSDVGAGKSFAFVFIKVPKKSEKEGMGEVMERHFGVQK